MTNNNMEATWVLGIDPGKSTGMAVMDIQTRKLLRLWTSDFWDAYHYALVNKFCWRGVVVEVSDNKSVFHKPAGGLKQVQRTAVNVGSVLREAELLAKGIHDAGIPTLTVNPRGKINAEKFKQLTGWEGQSNQHSRDAGLLAYRWKG